MAHLTKPAQYNIEDSNIALLGSELEKRVHEHAGDKKAAWETAGVAPGLQIWRIEQFHVIEWPQHRYGTFYDGDSYIILHTYRKSTDATSFSYNLHFWLGQNTTQDEAGTAAYKTVELDDHLHGVPVQYREVQNFESPQFLSYFPQFLSIHGGVATGFHHITEPPPLEIRKLYRVNLTGTAHGRPSNLVLREVAAEASSLIQGDVYVLDEGATLLQLNTKDSTGRERFKAAEFVRNLANERQGQTQVMVYDEGGPGTGLFLGKFGEGTTLVPATSKHSVSSHVSLFRLSDESGTPSFARVVVAGQGSLSSEDAFLLDDSEDPLQQAVYVWLGTRASLNERRLSLQYAQKYLYQKKMDCHTVRITTPIIKQEEGHETDEFIRAFGACV